ncbi:hypothetical protein HZC20_01520 [Candidatus Peregrinibacteria bacterium]|nr:hypothetical protein [Candidatus Peregrinibacteria bacterium]
MADSSHNTAKENISSPRGDGSEVFSKKETFGKEVKEATEVGKAAYVEAVGLDETIETSGRVSETLSNAKDQKGDTSAGGTTTNSAITINEIRARLLEKTPSEKVMRKQINGEIEKEIKYLHKKALKMMRSPGQISYFEMSNILKKIRELKGILTIMLKLSIDALKTLWLRFVHGLM